MSALVPEIIQGGKLSVAENKRLSQLESIIKENFTGFVAVGNALAEIRDRRLYRQSYKAFEEYCRDLWDMSHQRADQLIASKTVYDNLTTIVVKGEAEGSIAIPLPTNEAQARELAKLPPEEQVEVWQSLVNDAQESGTKITAKAVKKAVLSYKGEAIDKHVEKTKKETRENRTDFQSPEFVEAFDRFFDQVRIEREANWRYTSRKTVHNVLLGLLEVVAEAVPGTLDGYGCAMELADREKLKKAGFRIFRMDTKARVIEEYHHGDTWVLHVECATPKLLNDTFKQLLEDHMHLKG